MMKKAIAFLLVLGNASALTLPESKAPAKLLSLRGGATVPEIVLSTSGACAITTGLLVAAGKDDLANLLWLNLNKVQRAAHCLLRASRALARPFPARTTSLV